MNGGIARLLIIDPAGNRFKWVTGSGGRQLEMYNPRTEFPYLVGSATAIDYHDVSCFVPSKRKGAMQLIATAFWEYPDKWSIKTYRAGRRVIRQIGDDRPTSEICAWVDSMTKKPVR